MLALFFLDVLGLCNFTVSLQFVDALDLMLQRELYPKSLCHHEFYAKLTCIYSLQPTTGSCSAANMALCPSRYPHLAVQGRSRCLPRFLASLFFSISLQHGTATARGKHSRWRVRSTYLCMAYISFGQPDWSNLSDLQGFY
jgi:hypothetical protein